MENGFCDAPHRWRMPMEDGFLRCTTRWRIPMDGGFINGDGNPQMEATAEGRFLSTGDGNPMTKATAEGRLYNHSPRLASLPGVSCGRRIYRRRAVV